jgi:hypothetical protein
MTETFTTADTDQIDALKYPTMPTVTGYAAMAVSANGAYVVGDHYDSTTSTMTYAMIHNGVPTTILAANQTPSAADQLGAINDSGEVVGRAVVNGVYQGFTEINGEVSAINVPGSAMQQWVGTGAGPALNSTNVTAVGDNGEIGGSFVDAQGATHGFTEMNGVYSQIDVPGASETDVWGITTSGTAYGMAEVNGVGVGFFETGTGTPMAVPHVTPPTITPTPKMILQPKVAFIHAANGVTDKISNYSGKVYSDAGENFVELSGITATSYSLKNDVLSLFNANKLVDTVHINVKNLTGLSIEHNSLGVQIATAGHDVSQPGGVGTILTLHG